MSFVSLAEIKKFLNIPASVTSEDDILTTLSSQAETFIKNYCDRQFESNNYVEKLDGNGFSKIILREYPITAINYLKINNVTINPQDYEIDSSVGISLKQGSFPHGVKNIEVSYTAGYTNIPDDLKLATMWITGFWYDIRNDKRIGTSSRGKSGETINYMDDFPPHVYNILDYYRRFEIPTTPYQMSATWI